MIRLGKQIGVLGAILCLLVTGQQSIHYWVETTRLPNLTPSLSQVVLDRDGWLLRPYLVNGDTWRLPLEIDEVDPQYLDFLVRYEDKRFYHHAGVDYWAMLRAAWQAFSRARIVSGASTLTMQVARLLEQGQSREWAGKLRQIRVALALEQRLTKADILKLYIMLAPFGGNLEGVRAASLSYFGKEPKRLTTAQAALLVSLPQSPERRRPDRHPVTAKTARDGVLNRLIGYEVISPQEGAAAKKESVPASRESFPALASHLADRVTRDRRNSLVINTTLDRSLQQSLETLVRLKMADDFSGRSMAIMVLNHQSGEVLASVGSAGYFEHERGGFIDMTQAVRSPGSTLKPLVFALAFDQGFAHPETMIEDRPVTYDSYRPENFDQQYRGSVRLRDALQLSLNIPTVSLLYALGPAKLMNLIQSSGVEPRLPSGSLPGLAIGLGGVGLTLQDLVTLYAAIANQGISVPPVIFSDQSHGASARRIMSDTAAWYVSDILSEIPGPSNSFDQNIAYKTGTSYGYRDAWAIGFDGKHVIGVWTGRPDGGSVPGALGVDSAAPVLFEVFGRLKHRPDALPFSPDTALLVKNTGLPQPLKRFRNHAAALNEYQDGPKIVFPPDGSQVSLGPDSKRQPLFLKVQDGHPPFTWLADGEPILIAVNDRQSSYVPDSPGHLKLSVVDQYGHSQNVRITVD